MKNVIMWTLIAIVIVSLGGLLSIISFNIGARDTKPDIKPLSAHLLPATEQWTEAYGDNWKTQVAYNLAALRYNQNILVTQIQAFGPVDPNQVTN